MVSLVSIEFFSRKFHVNYGFVLRINFKILLLLLIEFFRQMKIVNKYLILLIINLLKKKF